MSHERMDSDVAPRALGILGGTFDPIHEGHLALAREAYAELDLERVLFVPNADPPHKQDQVVTPARHREAMVAAAIADEAAFVLSRIELERGGPSYAVDTIEELAAMSRADDRPEPWFILSSEALRDFESWREPERILTLCRIAVATRPGIEPLGPVWVAARYPGRQDRFAFLRGPSVDIAATDIRERVARGLPIAGLVPTAVAEYIETEGLYVTRPPAGSSESPPGDGASRSEPAASGPAADPRRARRPGLPASRRPTDGGSERLSVIPGAIDADVLALAHRIVELAADKKASDIVLLDVRGLTTMTDYFVICSGASDRQLDAIADGIEAGARESGAEPISREGEATSHWLLVDYGGVIVHVMSRPEREFYQLEKLWSDGALLLRIL